MHWLCWCCLHVTLPVSNRLTLQTYVLLTSLSACCASHCRAGPYCWPFANTHVAALPVMLLAATGRLTGLRSLILSS